MCTFSLLYMLHCKITFHAVINQDRSRSPTMLSIFLVIGASLGKSLLVRSTGEISVCMYGTFGRLNLDASTRYNFCSIRALVRLNRMRFPHVGHAARHGNTTMESVPTVSDDELRRQERLQRRRERERQQRACRGKYTRN